jgi:hypothetical protein
MLALLLFHRRFTVGVRDAFGFAANIGFLLATKDLASGKN